MASESYPDEELCRTHQRVTEKLMSLLEKCEGEHVAVVVDVLVRAAVILTRRGSAGNVTLDGLTRLVSIHWNDDVAADADKKESH